jgi:predicted alpha/beta-fold hydrolase
MTEHGGHAAWIGHRRHPEFDRFWMDQKVVHWVMGLS